MCAFSPDLEKVTFLSYDFSSQHATFSSLPAYTESLVILQRSEMWTGHLCFREKLGAELGTHKKFPCHQAGTDVTLPPCPKLWSSELFCLTKAVGAASCSGELILPLSHRRQYNLSFSSRSHNK